MISLLYEIFSDRKVIYMSTVINALSYTGILFFLPLVANDNQQEGKFHANQGLIALILAVVLHVIGRVLGVFAGIPLLGVLIGIVGTIFGIAAWAVQVAILIFGIVNSINGRMNPIPVIGKINLINK